MNKDEKIAENYLSKLNIGTPLYQPDGIIPPDFAIEKKLGIEVRRLNRIFFNNSKVDGGLEELQPRIQGILEQSLISFNSKYNGESFYVLMQFSEPINYNTRILLIQFNRTVQHFLDSRLPDNSKLKVNNFIELSFIKTTKKCKELFKYVGGTDLNTFGSVNAVIIENVSYCISEKSKKIISYKNKYKAWWLILVNHLNADLDDDDILKIKQYLTSTGEFDKVKVLNPSNLEIVFEL